MIAQRLTARRLQQLLGAWRGEGHGYHELGASITLLVRDGRIPPATVLPAERSLADGLGVSRTTVAAAYQLLRDRGIVASRRGSGTTVLSQPAAHSVTWTPGVQETVTMARASPAPWSGLHALAQRTLDEHPEAFLLDGYDTVGHPKLRTAIAERYTARGLPTIPEQVMVTLGAQHAIYLISRTLLRRGDRALIESPSYPHAREALAAAGAVIAEIPVGPRDYDEASATEIVARTSARLAYLIPDHHNPTGLSMPAEYRAGLIRGLAQQGTHMIADETTAELLVGEPRTVVPFAASASDQDADLILTVGSLGKTVWGGLRVGWIRATPELIARLEAERVIGDLGTGTWSQLLGAAALEHITEIIAMRAQELTAGHRTLLQLTATHLPEWQLSPARGGVSVWADLGAARSTRLSRDAAELGLRIPPGPQFGSPGIFERCMRLPFTAPEAELRRGITLLGEAWQLPHHAASMRRTPARTEVV